MKFMKNLKAMPTVHTIKAFVDIYGRVFYNDSIVTLEQLCDEFKMTRQDLLEFCSNSEIKMIIECIRKNIEWQYDTGNLSLWENEDCLKALETLEGVENEIDDETQQGIYTTRKTSRTVLQKNAQGADIY